MTNLQLELISKETIKPSSPTPTNLRKYNFSFVDISYPRIFMPVVLFYPALHDRLDSPSEELKKSLPNLLAYYYPLAGRIEEDGLSIDCNDEGVEFFESTTPCSLSHVLENGNERLLNQFFPSHVLFNPKSLTNLLIIQVTSFSCGGRALGVCMSHTFGDAASLYYFLNDWSKLAKRPHEILIPPPALISASVFPPHDTIRIPAWEMDRSGSVKKRFLFSATNIADLRAKVSTLRFRPTRVEAVIALLCKCAQRAEKQRSDPDSDSVLPTVIVQNVNLRTHVAPPLPENVIGNLVSFFPVLNFNDSLYESSENMRNGLIKICDKYANALEPNARTMLVLGTFMQIGDILGTHKGVSMYKCTSWCKLPMYEIDFGWGKPIWFGFGRVESKDIIALTDTKEGDGVEAWVTLEEQVMEAFQCDQELLSFASLIA